MPPSSSSSAAVTGRLRRPTGASNSNFFSSSSSSSSCNHSPSATLDLLILLLVLFSCTFLISSSLSYVFRSLSLILPSTVPLSLALALATLAAVAALSLALLPWPRRRCGNPRCKGLKKALEFDVQLQTEDAARASPQDAAWRAIDALPWKGGQGGNNPDYECLRAELRRMAPPNGRAVLLFRSRCGCPVAKLEAWGPKRGRKHKKGMGNLAIEGGNR